MAPSTVEAVADPVADVLVPVSESPWPATTGNPSDSRANGVPSSWARVGALVAERVVVLQSPPLDAWGVTGCQAPATGFHQSSPPGAEPPHTVTTTWVNALSGLVDTSTKVCPAARPASGSSAYSPTVTVPIP